MKNENCTLKSGTLKSGEEKIAICNPRPRRGFTLVEVLLTLALITIIAGVAWTALQRPMAQQRLRSAADAVKTGWCQARVDAMKSGHTYAFRYAVHGDRYHLGPNDDPSQTTPAPVQVTASDDELGGEDPLPPAEDKTLPQGIKFMTDDSGGDLGSASDDTQSDVADSGDGWSDPILFYSDGSTSDAKVVLAYNRHAAMRLSLRGITGSVTVGDAATMTQ